MRPGWREVQPNKHEVELRRKFVGHKTTLCYWGERHGWTASTPVGFVWTLFEDERQSSVDAAADAMQVCEEVVRTGQPPSGCWS